MQLIFAENKFAMKKKLPISQLRVLSILALIFYFVMVLSTFLSGVDDFKIGYDEGNKSAKLKSEEMTHYVCIKPKNGALNFPDTLINQKTNEQVSLKYNDVALIKANKNTKLNQTVTKFKVLSGVMMFLVLVLVILFPFYFVKIMISMKNGVVFINRNIRWVKRIGQLLLMYYVFNFIFDWSQYKINATLFQFNDYQVVKASTDIIWLLLGIVVLLFSEVLSKATILKEEQDLTI